MSVGCREVWIAGWGFVGEGEREVEKISERLLLGSRAAAGEGGVEGAVWCAISAGGHESLARLRGGTNRRVFLQACGSLDSFSITNHGVCRSRLM